MSILKLAFGSGGDVESYKPFILLVLISSTFYFFKKQLKSNSRRTIRDIPAIKHLPFWVPQIIEGLASLYRLHKRGVNALFESWASTNYSPMVAITIPFFPKVVLVSDPELIKKCLASSDSQFLEKPKLFYDIFFSPLVKDGLASANYSVWKAHRKILNKFFTQGTLQSQLRIVNKYAHRVITDLGNASSLVEGDQFYSKFHNILLTVMLEIMWGSEIVSKKESHGFLEKLIELRKLIIYRLFNPHNMIDFVWKLNPKRKEEQVCISYFEDFENDVIEVLKAKMAKDSDTSGMNGVEYMLFNKMSSKEIADEMSTLIVAGHETTDTTLHFLMQHLAEHPNIQKKCQEEVDLIFNCKDENCLDLTMDDLRNLKYVEQCILETLRLTPSFPMFARELMGEMELGNVLLEKGTMLLFSPWNTHRHPDYYPDAEKFDPDRFTQDKVQARHPYAFIAFSMGPRNCIGWKVAMMQMKTIISWILRYYTIHTKDKLADVKLTFEITLLPEKRKFNLSLERREERCKNLMGNEKLL